MAKFKYDLMLNGNRIIYNYNEDTKTYEFKEPLTLETLEDFIENTRESERASERREKCGKTKSL